MTDPSADDHPRRDGAAGARRVAVIAGDGIGPEVVAEAERVVARATELDPRLIASFDHLDWGSERYLRTGRAMPEDGLSILAGYDAILMGAIGDPRIADHRTLRELVLGIRRGFDLYVNLRPVKLLHGVRSPLRDRDPSEIDMLFVRENTEGEYAGLGSRSSVGEADEQALQTAVFSRRGVARTIRWAFELARREGRSLTSVSKANALEFSGGLWDTVFDELAAEHPDVPTARLLVDAAAMFMVHDPGRFEVVVASNLFGDILTDLGAGIMGGMGLAPSANLDPSGAHPSMFEPVHGSAPDIAGRGVADPIGTIWSAALMLEHLGFPEWHRQILAAIEAALAEPALRTADLGGRATTEQLGNGICERLTVPAGAA